MTLRSALILAAFAALARPARADNSQLATAAAAAMGGQTGGAAGAGAAAAAQGGQQGGLGRGFDRQISAPQIIKTEESAQKHAPAKKGKAAKSNASKYKSRELTENSEHVYRFNENGEPVSAAPKKAAAKASKKASSVSGDDDEKPGACSSDQPCPAKNGDSDAL